MRQAASIPRLDRHPGPAYWLTRALLAELRFELPQRSRILAFVGLGIVAGLGVILGLLLLVIPGLVLIARWSIATPLLLSSAQLSSAQGIFASLDQSWRQTTGYTWPILASFLIIAAGWSDSSSVRTSPPRCASWAASTGWPSGSEMLTPTSPPMRRSKPSNGR